MVQIPHLHPAGRGHPAPAWLRAGCASARRRHPLTAASSSCRRPGRLLGRRGRHDRHRRPAPPPSARRDRPDAPVDAAPPSTAARRGWCVYGPGSAHRPTVAGAAPSVLYLLPQGAIEFTGVPRAPAMNDLPTENHLGGRGIVAPVPARRCSIRCSATNSCGSTRPARPARRLRAGRPGGRLRPACDDLPRARRDAGSAVAQVLQARPRRLLRPLHRQQGTVKNDSAVDIDGGSTRSASTPSWARAGRRFLLDGEVRRAGQGRHLPAAMCRCRPRAGAVHQRLQLPSWGLWEKAAPALRRAGGGQARHRHRVADAAHGAGRDRRRRAAGGRAQRGLRQLGRAAGCAGPSTGLSFTGSADTAALICARHPPR